MTLLLSTLALGLAVGLLLGPTPPSWHAPLALLLSASAAGFVRLSPRWPLLGALCLLTSGITLGLTLVPQETAESARGGLARITVDAERSACGPSGCTAAARLVACEALEPEACPETDARLTVLTATELPLAARVRLLARLTPRPSFHNRSPAYRWQLSTPELGARAEGDGQPQVVEAPALTSLLVAARAATRAAFQRSLAPLHAGVARALLLGEAQAVGSDLNTAIRSSGISHILAVSGMHVTVLAGALVLLLKLCLSCTPLARSLEVGRLAAAAGVVLAPAVALFAGASPSAMRAAVAGSLTFLAVAWGRKPAPLAIATLAFVVCAVLFPADALHPGFVLSVIATHALLTLPRERGGVLRESLRTWLATAPVLWILFGSVQLVAVFANLAVASLGSALIPLVAVHAVIALAAPSLATLSGAVFEVASGAFLGAARLFASLDPGWALPPPSPLQAGLLVALALVLLTAQDGRTLTACTLGLGVALVGSELWLRVGPRPGTLEVTFLDVGQGDCAVLRSDSKVIVIDAGGAPQGGPDPGKYALLPWLAAHRVSAIDLFVLSHPHPDHYGGLAALAEAMPIRELWDNAQACAEDTSGPACRLLTGLARRGARIKRPGELCGRSAWGALTLNVLSPCPAFDEALEANDNSLVIRAQHGAQRFLFVGDAERATEATLSARYGAELRAQVLKVGHHGSRTSSTLGFVSLVQPELALISAGRHNRFGHPHREVVERLEQRGVRVLRTDLLGGVTVQSDGRALAVQSSLSGDAPQ